MSEVTDLTYAQIRARIASELNRDDLDTVPLDDTSEIHKFFKERVLYYSREFFYNAQFIDTSKSTAIGDPWVNLPDGWQQVNFVKLLLGSSWIPVGNGHPVPYTDIAARSDTSPLIRALPTRYAIYQNPTGGNMALRFHNVPDAVYSLELTMDKPPAAPTADADSSFWTNDAQALMISSTCEELCKRLINRPMKADEHRKVREAEEISLDSKSIRIAGGIRVRPHYW